MMQSECTQNGVLVFVDTATMSTQAIKRESNVNTDMDKYSQMRCKSFSSQMWIYNNVISLNSVFKAQITHGESNCRERDENVSSLRQTLYGDQIDGQCLPAAM